MQQDGVESLQSDTKSLEEDYCPSSSSAETEVILWPKSFENCTADSLIGAKVSKAIGWNMYDPDNAVYLACFLESGRRHLGYL